MGQKKKRRWRSKKGARISIFIDRVGTSRISYKRENDKDSPLLATLLERLWDSGLNYVSRFMYISEVALRHKKMI